MAERSTAVHYLDADFPVRLMPSERLGPLLQLLGSSEWLHHFGVLCLRSTLPSKLKGTFQRPKLASTAPTTVVVIRVNSPSGGQGRAGRRCRALPNASQ